MFDWILRIYYQISQVVEERSLMEPIRNRVFWQRTITPVEMDLSTVPALGANETYDYQFIELNLEDLRSGKWTFTKPKRGFNAICNLKKGLRGLAVVKYSIVLGDVWFITPHMGEKNADHPHLSILGISIGEGEAYAFDMFIDTAYRGKNLAAPFQRFLQSTLKKEGYVKVYGAYWDDNLPALWMHRMLKFKELTKRRVSRFFFLQRVQPLPQSYNSSTSSKKSPS